MSAFLMPSLGADMEVGTVTEWLVKPGDSVRRGDVVAIVDTEKAEIEIEIWQDGVVERLDVAVGEEVPVGTVLATLEGAGRESVNASAEERKPPKPIETARAEMPAPIPTAIPSKRLRASPLARRIARELEVDLSKVEGTGVGGAITKADVERAFREEPVDLRVRPQASEGVDIPRTPGRSDRATSMRRAIAKAMARSKREIPHYYLERSIDFHTAQTWLTAENARRPVTERLLPAALLLKATALALADVPELNGHFIDGVFRASDARHLGVAIAQRGGGLLAPAIHDVDALDLDSLMTALRDVVNRARRGKLRSSEVADATITITSLGDTGVDKVYGVIFPPQVALVGFGAITERPWAHGGMVGARRVLSATLAADHRVSDGARGAKFLDSLADKLAKPECL